MCPARTYGGISVITMETQIGVFIKEGKALGEDDKSSTLMTSGDFGFSKEK